jgi:hypothetical protein
MVELESMTRLHTKVVISTNKIAIRPIVGKYVALVFIDPPKKRRNQPAVPQLCTLAPIVYLSIEAAPGPREEDVPLWSTPPLVGACLGLPLPELARAVAARSSLALSLAEARPRSPCVEVARAASGGAPGSDPGGRGLAPRN